MRRDLACEHTEAQAYKVCKFLNHDESLHVGGLMLGNQVNGWGHWGFGVDGLLGKAGHNNNIGGVLPDQLDSNTSPSYMQANIEDD